MGMKERRAKCWALKNRYYDGIPTREERLEGALGELVRPTDVLLDAGCGSDIPLTRMYKDRVSMAIGVDRFPPAKQPGGRVRVINGDLERLPLRSGTVDTILSRSVIEHARDPAQMFTEFARVLRPGGKMVFTTPNKYYYSCVIASLIPDRLKDYYFHTVFGEDHYDYFPVFYRANTAQAFRNVAEAANLKVVKIEALRHYPYYFLFSPLLFRLGVYYDKLITGLGLDWLQSTWLVVMEKR